LNFLKDLPPLNQFDRLLPHVPRLRTWISHNLSFSKDHDVETLRAAQAWFMRTCGTAIPIHAEQWRACFHRLCEDLAGLLLGAIAACDALDSQDDGPRLVEELKKRLDRNWDAYLFDGYVSRACDRLGYSGLDVVAFRQRNLDQWRRVVAVAEDGAIERLIQMRVEASLLDLMAHSLPAEAATILSNLDLDTPSQVATAMLIIRNRGKAGRTDVPSLLRDLANEIKVSGQKVLS
jgi:hypothetical protein